MKRILTLSLLIILMGSLLAQVPQAIQYQAVIRDNQGNPLGSQLINLRISILPDSMTGQAEYTETHQVTTSNQGMVHLAIGQGVPVFGQFSGISWGSGPHFARVEMDIDLTGAYTVLTTSQLLSVPYALYAGSSAVLMMSTAERDAFPNPPPGMQILNSDDFCLNVYTGNAWMAYCGTCTPQPDLAYAGPDMTDLTGNQIQLQGIQPVHGSGSWSVISGAGGLVENDDHYNSLFTGHPGGVYDLVWTVSNSCASSSDTVQISFACDPQYIPADAGNDVAVCPGGCTQLTASGGVSYLWSTQEQAASISVCPAHTTTYTVTVTNDYGCTATASVTVTVNPLPAANAGPDLSICAGECTQLQASGGVIYLWSTQENTTDIQVCPLQTTSYTLTVIDALGCVAQDEVVVTVDPLPVANAGPDLSICAGECAQLQASGGAAYLWSTQDTTGVIEVCPVQTTTYSVTVSDVKGCEASDELTVTVNALPLADAGQDTAVCPGTCIQLIASGGLNYVWNTQENTAGIEVCPSVNSIYTATVTDLKGCSAIDSVIVQMLPVPDHPDAGPDSLNVVVPGLSLQANTPVIGSGFWTIISGQGGSFTDDTLATTQFTGLEGQDYLLVWTISTVCGALSDTVLIAFPYQQTFVQCGDTLTDTRDGQVYPTVQIGTQCWMAKNLNIGTLINVTGEQTNNSIIEKYCYDDNASNCGIYGGLYQWDEMMDYEIAAGAQGICPSGWHLPTDTEWCTLTTYLDPAVNCNIMGSSGTDAGGKMKETGTTYWYLPNTGATNSSGFSALPAGYRYNGIIYFLNHTAAFWSSSEQYSANGIYWYLQNNSAAVYRGELYKTIGFSVRCLSDSLLSCSPQPDQAFAGPDSINIPGTSIMLQGNQPMHGTGLWTIINGAGGILADSSIHNTLFTGLPGEAYTLGWIISNNCGSTSDTLIISFATQGVVCGNPFTDTRDGNTYNTVLIGNQCWMKEDLAYLPSVSPSSAGSETTPHYYVYDYQGTDVNAAKATSNYQTYGVLYNWPAAMAGYGSSTSVPSGVRGVCPNGWHMPSDLEWTQLETFLGGSSIAGGNLKETGNSHWFSPNTGATNLNGFTALPGGGRYPNGTFDYLGHFVYWWAASEYSGSNAWTRGLYYYLESVYYLNYSKSFGFSVRCISDSLLSCSPQPDQAHAGPDNLGVVGTNITLQANTPVNGSGQWTIVSGQGGSFVNDTLSTTQFNGQVGESYALVWSISTFCGSLSDTVMIAFPYEQTFVLCGDTLTDTRDGQVYPTVQIGQQCWMAMNLNIGVMVHSTQSANSHSDLGHNGTIEKYCYNNDLAHCSIYGGLYDWNEMMNYDTIPQARGICPIGWHIPVGSEWDSLTTYLDGWGIAGGKMKETGFQYWNVPNTGATNTSGFRALGAGFRNILGGFDAIGTYTYFWLSSAYSTEYGNSRNLNHSSAGISPGDYSKIDGFSVRCIIDE